MRAEVQTRIWPLSSAPLSIITVSSFYFTFCSSSSPNIWKTRPSERSSGLLPLHRSGCVDFAAPPLPLKPLPGHEGEDRSLFFSFPLADGLRE